jgi:hypothetical protein
VNQVVPLRLGVDEVGEGSDASACGIRDRGPGPRRPYDPPLTQTLGEFRTELAEPQVMTWGIRERGCLVASVRVRQADWATAEIGRLVVAPDR